ncbi:lipase family protein [Kytococcus sedentarius]|uniref:lipase family protein n=1 Tax=Kytococcus sedentarius TaxID=1276 RepID=UPI0035BC1F3C
MRRSTRSLAALCCGIALATVAPGVGTAAPATAVPWSPGFYDTPAALPDAPGVVMRAEKLTYVLDPADAASVSFRSTRILYTSTDSHGEIVPVSGAVYVPTTAWRGKGERPIVAIAPGTQGMDDRCAPSRASAEGLSYEMLAAGYAVAMTDYEGLGTEGDHPYVVRQSAAHSLLDVVRAAQDGDFGLSANAPVGLTGYSQGGTAAAAAAEEWDEYAPELRLKGVVAGAPAADLNVVADNLDKGLYSELLWYALAGTSSDSGVDLGRVLNEKGVAKVEGAHGSCIPDAITRGFSDSRQFTRSGVSIPSLLRTDPELRAVAETQKLGKEAPQVPTLVVHSYLDDVLPYKQARQMASDWCDGGATVQMYSTMVPSHVGGMLPTIPNEMGFFASRFAGHNAINSCWRL